MLPLEFGDQHRHRDPPQFALGEPRFLGDVADVQPASMARSLWPSGLAARMPGAGEYRVTPGRISAVRGESTET